EVSGRPETCRLDGLDVATTMTQAISAAWVLRNASESFLCAAHGMNKLVVRFRNSPAVIAEGLASAELLLVEQQWSGLARERKSEVTWRVLKYMPRIRSSLTEVFEDDKKETLRAKSA